MRIEVRELAVELDARKIVENVSLDLHEGEIVLLTGPSGSGKTTILRALLGIIPEIIKGRVSGTINPLPREISKITFYMSQEPWFSVSTPFVWSEAFSFSQKDKEDVLKLLEFLGLRNKLRQSTYTLSAGELQRLCLVSAYFSNSKYVLLDEPSSHLDYENAKKIREIIKKIAENGSTVLIVDHNIDVWKDLADNFLMLKDGVILKDYDYPVPSKLDIDVPKFNGKKEVLCSVSVEEFRYPGQDVLLKNINFEVYRGDIVLIKGPSGSGKTTLLRLIAKKTKKSSVKIDISASLCYVPDNPLLFFSQPTPLREVLKKGDVLQEYSLDNIANNPILKTSSGERRRIAVASAISRGFNLILFDEPTIGLDFYNKVLVLKTIVQAAERGLGFIIASHDPLIEKIATKVVRVGNK